MNIAQFAYAAVVLKYQIQKSITPHFLDRFEDAIKDALYVILAVDIQRLKRETRNKITGTYTDKMHTCQGEAIIFRNTRGEGPSFLLNHPDGTFYGNLVTVKRRVHVILVECKGFFRLWLRQIPYEVTKSSAGRVNIHVSPPRPLKFIHVKLTV